MSKVSLVRSLKERKEMAPRTRKIEAKHGLVGFYIGVTEDLIQDFLKVNHIERSPNSPKYMTTLTNTVISVPPADQYIVPDHVYTWIQTIPISPEMIEGATRSE